MSFAKSPLHPSFILLAIVVVAAVAYLTSFARPIEHFGYDKSYYANQRNQTVSDGVITLGVIAMNSYQNHKSEKKNKKNK